jgi:chorismate synthase
MIECRILNLPAGLGAPAFNKFNSDLGGAILSIPGIKSFEIGAGVKSASMRGSRFNDPIVSNGERISYSTNNAGGVLGGITNGSEVVFRAAVKPTPSISSPQRTVDLSNMEETIIETSGRFDVNYTPRVLVIAEALSAIITADHLMLSGRVSPESVIPVEERLRFGTKSKEGNR